MPIELTPHSNQVYIGDSYGGGNFIDIDEDKSCSLHCRCRRQSQPDDFVFTVSKNSSELRIAFHDLDLCKEVFAVTDRTAVLDPGDGAGTPTTFDGLAVLAKYEQLKQRLASFPSLNEGPSWAVLALSLLVDSFLTDREIFRTFGYENLYEHGCLSFELWKEFQRRQLDDDITLLDNSFTTFMEARARSTSPDAACDMTPAPGDIPVNSPDARFSSDLPSQENSDTPAETTSPEETLPQKDHGLDISALSDPIRLVAKGGHESSGRLLLDRDASVDGTGNHCTTPLAFAASGGHESIVRLLLDRGASVDGTGNHYTTPLAFAAMEGHESTVRLLLDRGASVDGVGKPYTTPLAMLARGGCESTVCLLFDWTDDGDFTPLAFAASGGHESIVRLLLDRGASIDRADDGYSTPLALAAMGGHESTVRLLLDRGASVGGVGKLYSTPLAFAARGGHESTLRLLLDRGSSSSTVDNDLVSSTTNSMTCFSD